MVVRTVPAAAIRVYTPDEMFVEKRDHWTLKCSFKIHVKSSVSQASFKGYKELGLAHRAKSDELYSTIGESNTRNKTRPLNRTEGEDSQCRGHRQNGLFPAAAIEVYTPDEVFVENGTTGMLKCSFKSTQVISSQASVSWSYTPEGSPDSTGVAIFYYSGGKAFPDSPQFKQRVEWAGDLNKKDASIRVTHMQFLDNGTYSCDVKNPPDISGKPSLTKLSVVMKEALPQTSPAVIVGAVIGAIIGVIIIAFVAYLLIRLIPSSHDYEGCTSIESVSTPATRPGKKAESSSEGSRCSSPSAPVQYLQKTSCDLFVTIRLGPVIYAQLDHSGSKNLNSVHKMEPVVYADIRKN
ncbi:hypothetical protein NFI96_015439 [Prochilodus magdalenae]|nr:hypothetical protein NFI96_015439 [Prochilodus magdalenae]